MKDKIMFSPMAIAAKPYAAELPQKHFRRWVKILEARAIRFYIEGKLDLLVADEDLYEEDGKYPNLDYCESIEKRYANNIR